MYYIRVLIYDFLSGFLYVLVLEALRSVLETLRCVLFFYVSLTWGRPSVQKQHRNGKIIQIVCFKMLNE